jgi:hypothetical protein
MKNFNSYNSVLISAFKANHKRGEIIARKVQLLNDVYNHYNIKPASELYIGFNPAMLTSRATKIFVMGISDNEFEEIQKTVPVIKKINNLTELSGTVETAISGDEFYTFFDHEDEQKTFLSDLRSVITGIVITTLKDYKNQDFKEREFSFPALVKGEEGSSIFLEYHEHDLKLKNHWQTLIYEIKNNSMIKHGPYLHRAVYFKQLAKFSSDAGFSNFYVHKNLMYKSLIRKNYEHVISFS